MPKESRAAARHDPPVSRSRLLVGAALMSVTAVSPAAVPERLSAQVDGSAALGAIEGRVRDDEGAAIFAARVELRASGQPLRARETDRLGFFMIEGLPVGTYELRAFRFGYGEALQTVVVAAGTPSEVVVTLPRQAVELEAISVEAERSRERIRFEEVGGATVRELAMADLKRVPGIAESIPRPDDLIRNGVLGAQEGVFSVENQAADGDHQNIGNRTTEHG